MNYSTATYWRIDYTLTTNQMETGMATLFLKTNQLPIGGSCHADQLNGTSLSMWFQIVCINWTDPDGTITKYEFISNLNFTLLITHDSKYLFAVSQSSNISRPLISHGFRLQFYRKY